MATGNEALKDLVLYLRSVVAAAASVSASASAAAAAAAAVAVAVASAACLVCHLSAFLHVLIFLPYHYQRQQSFSSALLLCATVAATGYTPVLFSTLVVDVPSYHPRLRYGASSMLLYLRKCYETTTKFQKKK